ncbi:hypothetical protein LZ190_21880 [Rhodovulum sulfidophilum]|nr:hypothetical protein [Rhodovulum sulfidophilum]
MGYEIGQRMPLDMDAAAFGAQISPQWYILLSSPQKEPGAQARLTQMGVAECWYPTETAYRRLARGRRKQVPYERRLAPGYVFVRLDREPRWHLIREHCRGLLRGIVSRHGMPLPIPEAAIAQMRCVPERIARIRDREMAARIIRPGDRAEIVAGPLAGWTVEVDWIDAGIAHFVLPLLGGQEASADIKLLGNKRNLA